MQGHLSGENREYYPSILLYRYIPRYLFHDRMFIYTHTPVHAPVARPPYHSMFYYRAHLSACS